MLIYIVTIAISAFFVPHYLSIFWEPLRENPWDIVGGAIVIVLLVAINIVGIREAASLNILLAVIDFATQLLLVVLGFYLVFSPAILVDNVHLGIGADVERLPPRDPDRDDRLHRDRDRLQPRRGGARPGAQRAAGVHDVAVAVFAIFLTLPADRPLGAARLPGGRTATS